MKGEGEREGEGGKGDEKGRGEGRGRREGGKNQRRSRRRRRKGKTKGMQTLSLMATKPIVSFYSTSLTFFLFMRFACWVSFILLLRQGLL